MTSEKLMRMLDIHREETIYSANSLTIFDVHFIITDMGEIHGMLPKVSSNILMEQRKF